MNESSVSSAPGRTRYRESLTTGMVARICDVAPRTVANWIDDGTLPGWRIPGSQDRRVDPEALMAFVDAHGMTGPRRRLVEWMAENEAARATA